MTKTADPIFAEIKEAIHRHHILGEKEDGVGDLIARFLDALHLNRNQCAKRLGVTPATVKKWIENGSVPEPQRINQFEALLNGDNTIATESQAVQIPPPTPIKSLRRRSDSTQNTRHESIEEVMARTVHAKNVWIAKCTRKFLADTDEQVLGEIVKNCRENNVTYHYVYPVFPEPTEVADIPAFDLGMTAKTSFERMKDFLDRHYSKLIGDDGFIKPHAVTDYKDMVELGIAMQPATWIMLVYKDEVAKQLNKDYDMWTELPNKEAQPFDHEDTKKYWALWQKHYPDDMALTPSDLTEINLNQSEESYHSDTPDRLGEKNLEKHHTP